MATYQIEFAVETGDKQSILQQLEGLEKLEIEVSLRLLLEGRALAALGRDDEAIEKLEQISIDEASLQALKILARLKITKGDYGNAKELLKKARAKNPSDEDVLRMLVHCFAAAGGDSIDWEEVKSVLSEGRYVTNRSIYQLAVLQATRGEVSQRCDAVRKFRRLANNSNELEVDALRFQAQLMLELIDEKSLLDSIKSNYLDETRQIFRELNARQVVPIGDRVKYCSFLMDVDYWAREQEKLEQESEASVGGFALNKRLDSDVETIEFLLSELKKDPRAFLMRVRLEIRFAPITGGR